MNNKITAVRARQIAEVAGTNSTIVKLNVDYILEKIIKEANKGELHVYISSSELRGHIQDSIIQETFSELHKLGYNAISADFVNNSKLYKVTW